MRGGRIFSREDGIFISLQMICCEIKTDQDDEVHQRLVKDSNESVH